MTTGIRRSVATSTFARGLLSAFDTCHPHLGGDCRAAAPGTSEDRFIAPQAGRALVQRLLPQHADRFEFETLPPANGRDVFELESRDGRIVIRGNTGVSLATGLNWYLNQYCHCHVSLHGRQLNLPIRCRRSRRKCGRSAGLGIAIS